LATAQLLAVVIGGGDWMEMGRFLVAPVFLLLMNIVVYSKGKLVPIAVLSSVFILSGLFYVRTTVRESVYRRFRLANIGYFPMLRGLSIGAKASFWGETSPVSMSPASQLKNFRCIYPFEALKAPNLRECYFLEAIHVAQHQRKLFSIKKGDKIMSYQAGMVPYYLMRAHPDVRFIDPVGLGSPERTSETSLAFKGLAGGGAGLSEEVFFKFIDRFHPEFIFDINIYKRRLIAAGYVPVVTVELDSSVFPYTEILYVRPDRLLSGGPRS
jgi:hypothetical protein